MSYNWIVLRNIVNEYLASLESTAFQPTVSSVSFHCLFEYEPITAFLTMLHVYTKQEDWLLSRELNCVKRFYWMAGQIHSRSVL